MNPAEKRLSERVERLRVAAESARSYNKAVRLVRKFHEARAQLVKLQITLENLAEEKQEYRCPHCHKTSSLARAAHYGIEARGL